MPAILKKFLPLLSITIGLVWWGFALFGVVVSLYETPEKLHKLPDWLAATVVTAPWALAFGTPVLAGFAWWSVREWNSTAREFRELKAQVSRLCSMEAELEKRLQEQLTSRVAEDFRVERDRLNREIPKLTADEFDGRLKVEVQQLDRKILALQQQLRWIQNRSMIMQTAIQKPADPA